MTEILTESKTDSQGTNTWTTEIGAKFNDSDSNDLLFSDYERETEKAICLSRHIGYTGLNGKNYIWIPKSIAKTVRLKFEPSKTNQCCGFDEVRNVYVPLWFYRQCN